MKNIIFASALLFTSLLFSQSQCVIKGSVTDAAMNNEPMLFANIEVKGSETSYQTNFHGNFEIDDLAPGSHTLTISYAGYQTEEVTIVVSENSVSQIETVLAPMQINFDNVSGLDTASKQETAFPSGAEKTPRE
ncbi:carboxypeptidase-like regulatory domain-containing protein [Maribacter sp. 2308TA10-17]|uniref:carboxypeptidase-like regulatory domain-containing protein n=1 Tax=Maribacter sp. 2308TA10-17 TaxID=3386276 RepID=UPI0039BCCD94